MGLFACGEEDDLDTPSAFTVEIRNVSAPRVGLSAGTFTSSPAGRSSGLIGPGEMFEWTVRAPPGARLSIATMVVPSNDLFLAPGPEGISLFLEPTLQPAEGDLTSQLTIWDAGTERDEPLGEGRAQANDREGRGQAGPAVGLRDPNPAVRPAEGVENLPTVRDIARLTVIPEQGGPNETTTFRVRLENASTASTLALPSGESREVRLSEGLWIIHQAEQTAPLFVPGAPDAGLGLEGLAEAGDPSGLLGSLSASLGPNVVLSPGVFAAFRGENPLFSVGATASMGLERLAEAGEADALLEAVEAAPQTLAAGTFTSSEGRPIGPGERFVFELEAAPPATLTFAAMYVPSNDVFLAPRPPGVRLFSFRNGASPVRDREVEDLAFFDAGTEVDAEPGFGSDQGPRQVEDDQGMAEGATVRPVDEAGTDFDYPSAPDVVEVVVDGRRL